MVTFFANNQIDETNIFKVLKNAQKANTISTRYFSKFNTQTLQVDLVYYIWMFAFFYVKLSQEQSQICLFMVMNPNINE